VSPRRSTCRRKGCVRETAVRGRKTSHNGQRRRNFGAFCHLPRLLMFRLF
jgi:hypothetical protein